jgi:hypothetical protein
MVWQMLVMCSRSLSDGCVKLSSSPNTKSENVSWSMASARFATMPRLRSNN